MNPNSDNIFSFLPKEDVITKRLTCKYSNEQLTTDTIRNILGPFTLPHIIYFFNSYNHNYKNIVKINNRLYGYNNQR